MSRKIVLGVVTAGTVAACAFIIGVLVHNGLADAGLWAAVVAALTGVIATAAAIWGPLPRPEPKVPPSPEQASNRLPPPSPAVLEGWVVGRPTEVSAVLNELLSGRSKTVGITTALHGAGGFGKTTLARMVCADPQIQSRFKGHVYKITIGRDVREPAAIAAKVNDVIRLIAGEEVAFIDPQLAGQRLGSILDAGPACLLMLDDVWEEEQLAPFVQGGKSCARLVTTRVPELIAGRGRAVLVDQMSPEQARTLLLNGLPPLDETVTIGLLRATGRWPLLLRMIRQILADYADMEKDASAVSDQAATLLERLSASGPAVVDKLMGDQELDVGRPEQRARAVRATIEASTGLLSSEDAKRFAELAVFAEDEAIPFHLVGHLWAATAGVDELRTAQVCKRLTQLALVQSADGSAQGIMLHDVIRDFLRADLQHRLEELNAVMLSQVAAELETPVEAERHPLASLSQVPWWEMNFKSHYMWDHLIEHLLDAGFPSNAETVACDLRWVGARLEHFGPTAPSTDLGTIVTPQTIRLKGLFERAAHLLERTEPRAAVVDILHSRVAHDPEWGPQVASLSLTYNRPRLINRWPLPDLAHPALRRVLRVAEIWTRAVAVASEGTWLASGEENGTVRIWDSSTGKLRAVLAGHTSDVLALAISPDSTWLVSGDQDGTLRFWDSTTGRLKAILRDRAPSIQTIGIAPDGTWLVIGSSDGTARILDSSTKAQRAAITLHDEIEDVNSSGYIDAVAIAPDGSWIAICCSRSVYIWELPEGRQREILRINLGQPNDSSWITSVAIAPDGRWLAAGVTDNTVRIWDARTGQPKAVLTGHTDLVEDVTIAPDGAWIASASADKTVRLWDTATNEQRAILTSHTNTVSALSSAPDGTWLASSSYDGTVRIWDTAQGLANDAATAQIGSITDTGISSVAGASDGTWLASAGQDHMVRIWDAVTRRERAALAGHVNSVEAVAISPDNSWLASAGYDDAIRIWDVAAGEERAALLGHTSTVAALAIAPDGKWLASASWDHTIRIWDAATGRQKASVTEITSLKSPVAIAPDSRSLAAADQNLVRIWDMTSGRQIRVLEGHTSLVTAVAIAPNGRWLASSSDDQTLWIWDMMTGMGRAVLREHGTVLTAVAIADDGRWLACAGRDGFVRIWDSVEQAWRAMMRIEADIRACSWLNSNAIILGSSVGVYVFDFISGDV